MKKSESKEMLNEGIIDTIKDKLMSVGKKLLSKFSPEEQASMKAAAEKVLGPNYSKEDITLDKAKEIGKIISGGLDESQQLDENLIKKIGGVLVGLGLPTAFVAGHGFGGTDVGAITAGIGMAAAMLGYAMTTIDEAQEAPKSNKMKKSELKEMIRQAFLQEDALSEFDMSLDDQAKAYFLEKVKRGEIDTLPEDPKAEFMNMLIQQQMGHDEETLRRERGLEEKIEEGIWAVLPARIPEFIQAVKDLKDEYHGVVGSDDVFNGLDAAISAAKELLMNTAEIREAEEDEEEVTVDDTEEEVTVDDTEEEIAPELEGDTKDILTHLESALEAAKAKGDEKLINQIGNTITFFTRQYVVKEEDLFEMKRMKRLAGILK